MRIFLTENVFFLNIEIKRLGLRVFIQEFQVQFNLFIKDQYIYIYMNTEDLSGWQAANIQGGSMLGN